MSRLIALLVLLAFAVSAAFAAEGDFQLPEKVRFNADIRPILSNTCFQCHGPDEKSRDSDLRLDTRDGAMMDLGGHAAIVPGKPAESALLERIAADDEELLMPPKESKKERLTPRQVALIRKWIEQGAEYEGHWAFLPLANGSPPKMESPNSVRNAVDAFILEKLSAHKLKPSKEADRPTLIRRLCLDLTGLLPSPEEVAAFVADPSPDAVERLADRLLADPHYGERWGRHWLDHARYADSNGYTIDGERAQWPYRDWVIRAFAQHMPFDQFTVEQLAGDLLPKPTKSQLVATAFHRNTLINQEGGTDAEQFRNEAVVDRVNTTAAVWLGLTAGCAQCHTHKYDPISHEEYYRLFAFFNQCEDVNNKGPTTTVLRGEIFGRPVEMPNDEYEQKLAERQLAFEQTELKRLEALQEPQPEDGPMIAESDMEKPASAIEWAAAKCLEFKSESNAGLRMLDDNSILADGRGDANDTYTVELTSDLEQVAALRLRVIPHESLPKTGPGLAGNGNFVLTAFEVEVDGKPVTLATAFADHEQPDYPAAALVDGNAKTGWAINVGPGQKAKMNAPHEAILIFNQPLLGAGKKLAVRMKHELNEKYLVGRFAIDVSSKRPAVPAVVKNKLLTALQTPAGKRADVQKKQISEAFFKADPEAKKWSDDIAARKKLQESLKAEVMISRDRSSPRTTYLLTRGDFLRPDQKRGALSPGVIAAVQQGFGPEWETIQFRDRLDLAHWIVHPSNPLTPRVTMNRVWLHLFGRGLVETEEDFGTQGTPPTHPELLDWLGREFVRSGWSFDHMQRLIVTSATYRQSSNLRSDLTAADPLNKLLGRQSRVRVEGEIVRDAALSAAGLLTRTIGGPSVHPPQPEGVYAFTQNQKSWKTPAGEDRFRRGVYTFFYRSAPYPLLTTFDSPDFQSVCTRRARSNTPLQSLTLANDAAFVEIAQGLALRILREAPAGDEAQLKHAFVLCLQREPSLWELEVLEKFYAEQVTSFENDSKAAAEVISPALKDSSIGAAQAAALVAVARVLLNTDGFITRE